MTAMMMMMMMMVLVLVLVIVNLEKQIRFAHEQIIMFFVFDLLCYVCAGLHQPHTFHMPGPCFHSNICSAISFLGRKLAPLPSEFVCAEICNQCRISSLSIFIVPVHFFQDSLFVSFRLLPTHCTWLFVAAVSPSVPTSNLPLTAITIPTMYSNQRWPLFICVVTTFWFGSLPFWCHHLTMMNLRQPSSGPVCGYKCHRVCSIPTGACKIRGPRGGTSICYGYFHVSPDSFLHLSR